MNYIKTKCNNINIDAIIRYILCLDYRNWRIIFAIPVIIIATLFILPAKHSEAHEQECSSEFVKDGVTINHVIPCGADVNSRPIFPSLDINFSSCKWEMISHKIMRLEGEFEQEVVSLLEENKFSCAFIRQGEILIRLKDKNFCKKEFCSVYAIFGVSKTYMSFIDYWSGDIYYAVNIKRNLCRLSAVFCKAGKSKFLPDYKGSGWMAGTNWHYYVNSFYTGLTPITVTPAALVYRGKYIEQIVGKKK